MRCGRSPHHPTGGHSENAQFLELRDSKGRITLKGTGMRRRPFSSLVLATYSLVGRCVVVALVSTEGC